MRMSELTREAEEDVAAGLLRQIEYHAELAAIDGAERRAVAAAGAGHRAGRVAVGRLHFDHPRAHVGQ